MNAELPPTEFDKYAELDRLLTLVRESFGVPATPEAAMRLVLMAKAALTPILELARDAGTVEWVLPSTIDYVEQADGQLDAAFAELELVADDVGIVDSGFDPAALVDMQGPARGLPR